MPSAAAASVSYTHLLLWQAILNMFEYDRSAARGKMAVRELIVFQHNSELGCAPAWKLFEAVKVERVTNPDDPALSLIHI